jgi:hypothetical protein
VLRSESRTRPNVGHHGYPTSAALLQFNQAAKTDCY